jgi:threonine/homoserine efflux transporter RhtA
VALKDPEEKKKALLATGTAFLNLGKSILQGSMDKNLFSDFATLGSMGVEKLRQTNASRIYISIYRQVWGSRCRKVRTADLLCLERRAMGCSLGCSFRMSIQRLALKVHLRSGFRVRLCLTILAFYTFVPPGRDQASHHQRLVH